jgi:hypothetical protein
VFRREAAFGADAPLLLAVGRDACLRDADVLLGAFPVRTGFLAGATLRAAFRGAALFDAFAFNFFAAVFRAVFAFGFFTGARCARLLLLLDLFEVFAISHLHGRRPKHCRRLLNLRQLSACANLSGDWTGCVLRQVTQLILQCAPAGSG